MNIFERMAEHDYEQLVFCYDRPSGLRAIIAIHDTTLGPALGGTRFWPYTSEEEAIVDALRLARAMGYKSAAAGLDLGGGKCVVIGDPRRDKSEALLRALGRFIQSLNGRYITATDVGTTDADMEVIGQETRFFTGRSEAQGGSGGTSAATGLGLYMGMKACAKEVYGDDSLRGKRVMVQGVGKVGGYLMEHLAQEGAELIVADVNQAAVQRPAEKYRAKVVPPDEVFEVDCDVFSPNALGPVLDDQTIPLLRCRIVCGGANNQLAEPRHGQMLMDRGILYAPDYIVNAGGVINVAHEFEGYVRETAHAKVRAIYQTVERVIAISKERGIPTSEAADRLAEERIQIIRAIHRNYLPARA